MKGAYEAENALYTFLPKQVPQPVAWGTYVQDPDTHFYICGFVDMFDDLPSAGDWGATVSALHLNSMGKSPNGQFGFHVNTHLANVPVDNTWNTSWEKFWAQQMKSLFDREEEVNGPHEELTKLKTHLFERVIPRYLGPLESDGRSIEPCLIHSDLWPGNIKPKADTDELCIFDACAYWGHNEGTWACRPFTTTIANSSTSRARYLSESKIQTRAALHQRILQKGAYVRTDCRLRRPKRDLCFEVPYSSVCYVLPRSEVSGCPDHRTRGRRQAIGGRWSSSIVIELPTSYDT